MGNPWDTEDISLYIISETVAKHPHKKSPFWSRHHLENLCLQSSHWSQRVPPINKDPQVPLWMVMKTCWWAWPSCSHICQGCEVNFIGPLDCTAFSVCWAQYNRDIEHLSLITPLDCNEESEERLQFQFPKQGFNRGEMWHICMYLHGQAGVRRWKKVRHIQ